MSLTLTNPTLGPGVVDATDINENFSDVSSKFGNIDNSDIKSAAGISIDKLSASYEYLPISVKIADGTAANEFLYPLYNDSKGDWTPVGVQWATADTGTPAGTCVFKIDWGVYNGAATTGAFTSTTTVATVTLAGDAIASQGVQSSVSTCAFGGAGVYRAFRFYVSTTDADCGSPIYATLLLKRQIKS